MAEFKLSWDEVGEKLWETGLDRGVLYQVDDKGAYGNGEAWNGLTSFEESPSGGEANPFYADNIEYANVMSAEKFGGTIGAYTYPDGFAACNGEADLVPGVRIGQQKRKMFGFSYRTRIGNDVDDDQHGYKIHLVYGCKAAPSSKSRSTVNESPELAEMSWEVSCTAVKVDGFKPTAHLEIDSTTVDADKLAAFEAILYGSAETDARMPLPAEVATLIGTVAG